MAKTNKVCRASRISTGSCHFRSVIHAVLKYPETCFIKSCVKYFLFRSARVPNALSFHDVTADAFFRCVSPVHCKARVSLALNCRCQHRCEPRASPVHYTSRCAFRADLRENRLIREFYRKNNLMFKYSLKVLNSWHHITYWHRLLINNSLIARALTSVGPRGPGPLVKKCS